MSLSEHEYLLYTSALRAQLQVQIRQQLGEHSSPDAIADILDHTIQGVWERVFRPPLGQPPVENVEAYLRTAVRNNCQHYLRDLSNRALSLSDLLDTDDDQDDTENEYPYAEQMPFGLPPPYTRPNYDIRLDVRHALTTIPTWAADLLIRYYVEGMTLEEIQQETGMPRSTLGDRLQRARAWLRRELRGYEGQGGL